MFWYNGQLVDSQQLNLEIDNPGLCYGATVFTTMRVYEQSLNHSQTCWLAHCDRLNTTIKIFNWLQPNWQQIQQGAELLLPHYPVLRIAVFPDGKEWITGRALPSDLQRRQEEGIIAWLAQEPMYRRDLPQYKTGNYLSAYLARQQALRLNAQEAILTNAQGNWLETSTGNLWGWKNNGWYTPDLDSGILPGIARSRWLDFLRANKIKVAENTWTPNFVSTLQALSYSNCVVDLVPITTVIQAGNRLHYPIKQP